MQSWTFNSRIVSGSALPSDMVELFSKLAISYHVSQTRRTGLRW
jgi:hypothetical protein